MALKKLTKYSSMIVFLLFALQGLLMLGLTIYMFKTGVFFEQKYVTLLLGANTCANFLFFGLYFSNLIKKEDKKNGIR